MIHLLVAKLFPWAVRVRWRSVVQWGAAGAFVLLLAYCYLQHVALEQNQIIYRNPAVVHQTRVVRVEGPVRIVTRVVETPGRVERETVEERGPVSVVKDSLTTETPVFPPAQRLDRWLVGVTANPFRYRDSRPWGAYVGYGFRNRLDIMCGLKDRNPSVVIVARF